MFVEFFFFGGGGGFGSSYEQFKNFTSSFQFNIYNIYSDLEYCSCLDGGSEFVTFGKNYSV